MLRRDFIERNLGTLRPQMGRPHYRPQQTINFWEAPPHVLVEGATQMAARCQLFDELVSSRLHPSTLPNPKAPSPKPQNPEPSCPKPQTPVTLNSKPPTLHPLALNTEHFPISLALASDMLSVGYILHHFGFPVT